jgi:hypothetical protein
MQLLTGGLLAVVCTVQCVIPLSFAQEGVPAVRVPPVRTSVVLKDQPVTVIAWADIASVSSGIFRLAMTADLGDLQDHLTQLLQAELNRSDRCGERLSVAQGTLAPKQPIGVLTASVHYERWGCIKAFGKQVEKRLVGGNAVVEVRLTPSVEANHVSLQAEVEKIDADGSLGEVLRSGSLGDSIRQKIAASIESAIERAVNPKSTLPAQIQSAATLQTVQFEDGGAGRLHVLVAGEVHISPEQFHATAKQLAH